MSDEQSVPDQLALFDNPKSWKDTWIGMPEFIQEKQEPYTKIIVRIASEEDLVKFSKAIGQKLTNKTKSIWFPFRSHFREGKQPEWHDEP